LADLLFLVSGVSGMARIGRVSAQSVRYLRIEFQRISSLRDLLFIVSLFLAVAIFGWAVGPGACQKLDGCSETDQWL
jgi:hypothetical protein